MATEGFKYAQLAMPKKKKVTYQLQIEVSKPIIVNVGKLGCFEFPAGHYIYTGSAKKNIGARIARHKSKAKKLRWHIDYLLNDPNARITSTTQFTEEECTLNQSTKGKIIVHGLGSSDCKRGCQSHLKLLG